MVVSPEDSVELGEPPLPDPEADEEETAAAEAAVVDVPLVVDASNPGVGSIRHAFAARTANADGLPRPRL